MEFFQKSAGSPGPLGILAGAFHPPTCAHLGIARAALSEVDEVLFVLPKKFPHKEYQKVGIQQRLDLLLEATACEPRFSVGVSEGGLFIDIARECRQAYGEAPELWFLVGSDAAERIVNWDYGEPTAFAKMLDEFGLLVVDRTHDYEAPPGMRHRIRRLVVPEDYTAVSATDVRERITKSRPWEHLVPVTIVEAVRRIYSRQSGQDH
jgi:nicotinate (nicotinamide) nucleotide adenylyltransferase